MAHHDPVDPHLLRLLRLRRTVGCRCRGGQRGAHLSGRRRLGDPVGIPVHLRFQRQLQPVRDRGPSEKSSAVRPLAGLATVVAIGLIVALAVSLFRGSFTQTVPVTVISDRAGLVMNPDAKVKMRGVQVGKVSSIEDEIRRHGGAASGDGSLPAPSHPVQRERRHRIVDGVRREVRQHGAAARSCGAETPPWTDHSGSARDGRNKHCVPATGTRCSTRSTPSNSIRPSARSRRRSTAAARRSAGHWPISMLSWPRSNRACRTSATTSRPLCRRSTRTPMRRPTSYLPSRIRHN